MMLKKTLLTGLLLTLTSLSTFAQVPDPRDSVILETKAILPDSGTGGIVRLRVWITNKDTIVKFGLGLQEKSLFGGAYLTLAWPRTFAGTVIPLTLTLPIRNGNFSNYHSDSPDSFDIRTSGGGADAEPPNDIRKGIWDIKFDTVRVDLFGGVGIVEFDSVVNDYFSILTINSANNFVPMNFVKGSVFVGIGDFVSDVEKGNRPKVFTLFQNYPNPFNANTQITFALSKAGRMKLEIFNLLGQEVSTLVDEYLSARTKIVNWNGRDNKGIPVPSGVYFYQLRSDEFRETKKMLVLK